MMKIYKVLKVLNEKPSSVKEGMFYDMEVCEYDKSEGCMQDTYQQASAYKQGGTPDIGDYFTGEKVKEYFSGVNYIRDVTWFGKEIPEDKSKMEGQQMEKQSYADARALYDFTKEEKLSFTKEETDRNLRDGFMSIMLPLYFEMSKDQWIAKVNELWPVYRDFVKDGKLLTLAKEQEVQEVKEIKEEKIEVPLQQQVSSVKKPFDKCTDPQLKAIHSILNRKELNPESIKSAIGVLHFSDLSKKQASRLIEYLARPKDIDLVEMKSIVMDQSYVKKFSDNER